MRSRSTSVFRASWIGPRRCTQRYPFRYVIWLATVAGSVLWVSPQLFSQRCTSAQPTYCPSTGRTIPAGTPCDKLDSMCPAGNGGGSSNPGPSEAEIEAQRKRAAEELLKQLEHQQQIEEQRQAAERARAEAEWKAGVADAAAHLKGVSPDNMQLKGVDSSTFGLKGVSPEEAVGNPAYGIKARSADSDNRDVSTGWQQLHCSAELANFAVEDVHKIATGEVDARELDEVKYLAGQAMEALHGNPVGVQCSSAPPMHLASHPDPRQLTPVYEKILTRAVHDGETLVASRQKAEILKTQLADLKAQATSRYQPPQETSSNDPASAAQNPVQGIDQLHKDQASSQQNPGEQKRPDYLELLRQTQRALNEANSEAIHSAADIAKVHEETQAILAGQLPSTSSSTQNPALKKQPGEDQ